MNELTERRIRRLGVVTIAVILTMLSIALVAPLAASDWPYWLAIALIAAIGIGLLFRARFARLLGILGALACIVLGPRALYQALELAPPIADWDATMILAVANAAASTLLGVWLALRTVQVLADRTRTASALTARIVGGTFAIVAIDHLWLAHLIGFSSEGYSISASAQGIQLAGFPGWPVWHAVMLLAALAMLFAPRRMLHMATTLFALLAVALVALSIVIAIRLEGPEVLVFVVLTTSLGAYLAWWLRDETRALV